VSAASQLTARQRSELQFHRVHAAAHRGAIDRPVALDILATGQRRPWNAYWSMYDRIMAAKPEGKRVLVPGCGFGDDAIRLALLGAHVSAFDLSPESLQIARARARLAGVDIAFDAMPAENLSAYEDASFDLVIFVDILHHVDIPATIRAISRVVRPGGEIIGDELYTHSLLQRLRESAAVEKLVYPLIRRWIYGGAEPYITPDEHKIDERELACVLDLLDRPEAEFFGRAEGRLFPSRMKALAWIDKQIMHFAGPAAARLGGRVVFSGKCKA
jgi:2-polyprenyl-3-methyl-5-hydroxy-6-metoxy-1,4-benzoquinol methylase